jgi:hypothetical protein
MNSDPSGAPWPYETVDPQKEMGREPSWACPEGFCECGGHHDWEEREFAIRLRDPFGAPMAGARCRVWVNGKLANEEMPHADGNGWVLAITSDRVEAAYVE